MTKESDFLSDLEQAAQSTTAIGIDKRTVCLSTKYNGGIDKGFVLSSCDYDYRIVLSLVDRQWVIYFRSKYAYSIAIERYIASNQTINYDYLVLLENHLSKVKEILFLLEDKLGQALPSDLWDLMNDESIHCFYI